ncbi:alpha/beta hydrolase family protein [Sphingopyxis macrogoltabida]|nr:prolyl oligopeptidase family serine peptidase [Sphingopyxis macrogoltabida]
MMSTVAAEPGPPAPAPAATAPLPTQAFAGLPFVEGAQLSPDGKHLAGLFAVGGEQRIVMHEIGSDFRTAVMVKLPEETEVRWLRWVGNDNVIAGVTAMQMVTGDRWYISRLVAISRTTGRATKLLWELNGQNAADLLWIPTDGSTEILVAGQDSIYSSLEFWPAVYRVDVTTGRKRLETKAREGVSDWGADHLGHVRYGIHYRDETTKAALLYRPVAGDGFQWVDRARLRDEEELVVPFLFVPGGDNGFAVTDGEDGRSVVTEVDLVTGRHVRTVYAAKGASIERLALSVDGSKLLGVYTNDPARPVHWLDPVMAAHQQELDGRAPMAVVRIESYSQDLAKMLVRVSTPENPGLLFYYDTASGHLAKLAEMNEAIGSKRLSRAKMVQYKARDGLAIEGVLTLPRHRTAKALPFIVMPHGGPWAHDALDYDYWAQFLAERGYGVLQPNFRGSTGYGAAFERAGQGQLGFAMQDDVSDGVEWAVKEGIADPKRVCIVGGSYGGYAAMWGIAKDPDLYRCAISIAGVANLRREVNDFARSTRGRLYRGQWEKMTPDFAAVSPINAIVRIKAPLLLIHGRKDVTVDHVQSVKMHAAMTKAGKAVEFVSVPLADHYFSREADRMTLLTAMENFLQKYNPPDGKDNPSD